MSLWWSAFLTPLGLVGMYVTGKKKRWGWLFGLTTQVAWIAYAVFTHQWFFIIGSLAYAGIYLKNYLAWGKEEKLNGQQEGREGTAARVGVGSGHRSGPVHRSMGGEPMSDEEKLPEHDRTRPRPEEGRPHPH